jgi:hypothetical protein
MSTGMGSLSEAQQLALSESSYSNEEVDEILA